MRKLHSPLSAFPSLFGLGWYGGSGGPCPLTLLLSLIVLLVVPTYAVDVNCVGQWDTTTPCTVSCGGGTLVQTFHVTTAAQGAGVVCGVNDGDTRTQSCNAGTCPAVNCVGQWDTTTPCSVSCGSGQLVQTFHITTQAQNGGVVCGSSDGDTRSQSCNTDVCPPAAVDCVGQWDTTTPCSVSCGSGQLVQTFHITTQAQNGGVVCGSSDGDTRSQSCNTDVCPRINIPSLLS